MVHFSAKLPAYAIGLTLGAFALASAALAAPITIEASTMPFALAGFTTLNLANAALGSGSSFTVGQATVAFDGLAADQGVVKGSVTGEYAAPVTDTAGDTFARKYLSTGDAGTIDITFAHPRTALALLWGSIDPSNEIEFFNGTEEVGVIDGSDIDASAAGFQGVGGSDYVMLTSTVRFDNVRLSSGAYSFEFAELGSATDPTNVHEPASFAILGAGLLGLVSLRRRPTHQRSAFTRRIWSIMCRKSLK